MSTAVALTGSTAQHGAAEALLERLLSAYSAHDAEALGTLYTEDAVVRIGELEFRGRRAVTGLWAHWFEALPDVSTELERVVVEPSRLWLEWTERGTHRGRIRMGDLVIPGRGRPLCWRGVSVYELSGGEITSVDYYVDRLQAAEQLVKPVALALRCAAAIGRATDRPPLAPRRHANEWERR